MHKNFYLSNISCMVLITCHFDICTTHVRKMWTILTTVCLKKPDHNLNFYCHEHAKLELFHRYGIPSYPRTDSSATPMEKPQNCNVIPHINTTESQLHGLWIYDIPFSCDMSNLICVWPCIINIGKVMPTTTTGHYTICCKNLSLTLLKMGKRLPETCWADLGDQ